MITTKYVPASGSAEIYENGRWWTDDDHLGIAKTRVLDVDTSWKITASVAAFIVPALTLLIPGGLGFIIFMICMSAYFWAMKMVWMRIDFKPVIAAPKGITDEVEEVAKVYRQMLKVRSMLPEGAGMRERIDEYGRIAYLCLLECQRLPQMSGKYDAFYAVQNELQTKLRNLADAGTSLVNLIATRRAENTITNIEHLGINEYIEHVSLETMAYRSLGAGTPSEPVDLGTPDVYEPGEPVKAKPFVERARKQRTALDDARATFKDGAIAAASVPPHLMKKKR